MQRKLKGIIVLIGGNMTKTSVRRNVLIANKKGDTRFVTFNDLSDQKEHIALVFKQEELRTSGATPLVRIHSECFTGDIFGSSRCDCGDQLDEAIETMMIKGGIIIYLRQEGRGIGLYSKIDAYELQDKGYDTFEANEALGHLADDRSFHVAQEMLSALGIHKIKLLTNNPEKASQLIQLGIEIEEVVKTGVYLKKENFNYLMTKAKKGNHKLDLNSIINFKKSMELK